MSTFTGSVGAIEARRAGFDAPIAKVLDKDFVTQSMPYYTQVLEEFYAQMPKLFGASLETLPIRHVLTRAFGLRFRPTFNHRHDFRRLLAEMGLPSDLSEAELAFFEANPKHPLFASLNDVPMPKRWSAWTLAKSHQLYFVIDAVREAKRGSAITKRNDFDQFKRNLEDVLGQSIESFRTELGHLDLQAAPVAAEPSPATVAFPNVVAASGTMSLLDAPVAKIVSRDDGPVTAWDRYDEMVKLAKVRLGPFEGVTVRDVITHEFARNLRTWNDERLDKFKSIFAFVGLPANLSEYELRLFEASPKHPLFESIDTVKLPKRFAPHSLGKSYGVFFVIDAVRELRPEGRLSARPRADEFRKAIADVLGRPFESIEFDRGGHLIGSEPASPSENRFVTAPGAACAVALGEVPTDVLLGELLRRKQTGEY